MATSYLNSTEEQATSSDLTRDYIQEKINELIKNRSVLKIDAIDSIRDVDWVKESITATIKLDGFDKKSRFLSSADSQFEDSSLGGNWCINPLPQFTRYADPRSKGLLIGREEVDISKSNVNLGMGLYYSEAFNDTKQVIHMRFGRPEFNSLLSFFTGFFDNDAARLANSGSIISNFTYVIGKAAALVINVVYWPLLALHSIGYAYKFFAGKPASKFYYLRPQMPNYWTAVTAMLNQLLVYKKMLPIDLDFQQVPVPDANGKYEAPVIQKTHQELAAMMPGIYSGDTGFVDVYKIANRAQKIRNHVNRVIDEETRGKSISEIYVWAKKRGGKNWLSDPGAPSTLTQAAQRWYESEFGKATKAATNEQGEFDNEVTRSIRTPETGANGSMSVPGQENPGLWQRVWEAAEAEYEDGSQFATFRVDYTGAVDESFSNSVSESDIANKFNSVSAQARSASFSLSNGNIDGGVLSGIIDAGKGLVQGTLSGLHMSGLLSLAGAAFVDIPKHWENSSASMSKMNYSMQLVSPYGNFMSQLINIHLPICMLLAAALPASTGAQSYTSPFLVELYDQGRAQTRLGIIDSLSITRGTTNLGFNKDKVFMSADVNFSVVDLSSVMHMPLTSGMFSWNNLNPLKALFGEDTAYSDYLHVLAGASLQQAIYKSHKLRDNALVYFKRMEALFSADRWAGVIHDTPIGMLDMFLKGTQRGQ